MTEELFFLAEALPDFLVVLNIKALCHAQLFHLPVQVFQNLEGGQVLVESLLSRFPWSHGDDLLVGLE